MVHLKLLTTVQLLWLRGFSGEEEALWSRNEILNWLCKWWWNAHAQNALLFGKSRFLYIAGWTFTRRHGKSIYFHLFIFINVVATIVIFRCFWNLSEISCAISCCLPTDKLTTFTHNKVDSKYLIFLWLASYQFHSINSELVGMCRPKAVESQDSSLWNHVKTLLLIHSFHKNIWLFQINKKSKFHVWEWLFIYMIEFH